MTIHAYRGAIAHTLDDPATAGDEALVHWADGALVIEGGHVIAVGEAGPTLATLADDTPVTQFEDALIVPGFVDTHIHYPQIDMIASYGDQLLDWLTHYTFPEEAKFADPAHATEVAEAFLGELLRNGTTTALVYGTVHANSVDALMEGALARNMRLIAGKCLMDRNVPDEVRDTAASGYAASRELILRWRGQGRLGYAVTPRFAPACSHEQLDKARALLEEFPEVLLQTHISENKAEIEWVKELFPEATDYLDVYDRHGLVTDRSVFAHGIHLCEREYARLSDAGSALAFCPTSNLFLGSGLFDLDAVERREIKLGLGTDVGGGTSLSLLTTLSEAYKVCQLQERKLSPAKSLYLATLGGARALNLGDKIGNFEVGKEADFIVLDRNATSLIARRTARSETIEDLLFAFSILGDDRAIRQTYVAGKQLHIRD